MARSGFTASGSSSEDARTTTSPSMPSRVWKIALPHTGQKRRLIVRPLSAVLMYSLTTPVSEKASSAKTACVAWPVPPSLRQSAQ